MWFRRDLRARDNAALHEALARCARVHCVFVFDTDILDPLPRRDRRVEFIRESLVELDAAVRGLVVLHGRAVAEIPHLARELGVQAVFANRDDEPRALARDAAVRTALAHGRIEFHTFKDHVVFERRELLTQAGAPYSVFTPYKKAWLAKLDAAPVAALEVDASRLATPPSARCRGVPTLEALGFEPAGLPLQAGTFGAQALLDDFLPRISRYARDRDYPAVKGPSYLGVHLRFGTVSIRQLVGMAHRLSLDGDEGAATWLAELAWRDFYFQILANFPHVVDGAFKPAYDAIEWEQGEQADALFAAWCEGRTGYPLVDAAMLQLSTTGYMHNRLRMVAASFLVKHLGIDWRRGERWFAQQLLDYDLAANNGGWQWAASTGCDAQPWFRIFNPETQRQRFDGASAFIDRYLPPPGERPAPVVEHAQARERTLQRYSVVKQAPR
jgi:deoxyribodipyrimidine photo-lyase